MMRMMRQCSEGMDTELDQDSRFAGIGGTWGGSQLGIDSLHLSDHSSQRGSNGPDWTGVMEGVLQHVGHFLDAYSTRSARSACRTWRRAFSLNVTTARLGIGEHRAAQARAFLRAFVRAYPSTTELVLDVTFRRTAREKIQAALEEHFQAVQDFSLQVLQINLDLSSFNERKIKLLDLSLLASWSSLTRLIVKESGWRSQQLRVDASTVFSSLPALQELAVVCKYSGQVKAKWWRPPSTAERLPARMLTWPPAAGSAVAAAGVGVGTGGGHGVAATATSYRGIGGGGSNGSSDFPGFDSGVRNTLHSRGDDMVMEDIGPPQLPHAPEGLHSRSRAELFPGGPYVGSVRPVVTQHLRCQMTQNQSMSGELTKALKRINTSLRSHVVALTFEIVEETYAEPSRCATPLELSALPGLKSLTVLSGAEDALAHSRLELVGATGLQTLVLFDVSCGCWCYKKPGHGIPPRLLSAPPAYLRSLTVVGFVVNQCQNLHALSSLTCLEELRLEQPDPDCLAAVAGELLLTWLPSSLKTLKLHSVVLPPCGVPVMDTAMALVAGLPLLPQQHNYRQQTGSFAATGAVMPLPQTAPPAVSAVIACGGGGAATSGGNSYGGGSTAQFLCSLAAVAPLPQLRELYLSKCKVPTLGVLGMCSHLTALGVINCLSCSGMLPIAAAMPALRFLAVTYTLAPEPEHGAGGAVMPSMLQPPAFSAAAAATAEAATSALPELVRGGFGGASADAGLQPVALASRGPVAAATFGVRGATSCSVGDGVTTAFVPLPSPHHLSPPALALQVAGLPLLPVMWGSDEQVAAVAACRTVTSLELILPRGTAGSGAVAALASLPALSELDVSLPCGLSECMMGLAHLGRSSGSQLRRLTLWVDGRTCVNHKKARQLQAIQRSLQAHMPNTLVEWAGAESRQGSWTGLEARVFNAY